MENAGASDIEPAVVTANDMKEAENRILLDVMEEFDRRNNTVDRDEFLDIIGETINDRDEYTNIVKNFIYNNRFMIKSIISNFHQKFSNLLNSKGEVREKYFHRRIKLEKDNFNFSVHLENINEDTVRFHFKRIFVFENTRQTKDFSMIIDFNFTTHERDDNTEKMETFKDSMIYKHRNTRFLRDITDKNILYFFVTEIDMEQFIVEVMKKMKINFQLIDEFESESSDYEEESEYETTDEGSTNSGSAEEDRDEEDDDEEEG